MITVVIQAYDLQVRIESGESHPDHLTDLASRACVMFSTAVVSLKAANIPIAGADHLPGEPLEENEELEE